MKKKQRLLSVILFLLLLAAVCGWFLYSDYKKNSAADTAIDEIQEMKPPITYDSSNEDDGTGDETALPLMDFTNLPISNPDITAWLTIPDTGIDYPVAQTADNDYYLHRDAQRKANKNGALFLDYRVHADFSDFNSVIYGHNMRNGKMFGKLTRFKAQEYFNTHPVGMLYTPGKTYRLEIFAVAVVKQNSDCYDYAFTSPAARQAHLRMISENAKLLREDIVVTEKDRIVTLSTCSYEFMDARTVVIAKLAG
jgi:sortase B